MEEFPVSSSFCLGVNRSFLGRSWRSKRADEKKISQFCRATGLSDGIARILVGRDLSIETADAFLNPTLRSLMPDPSTLIDMDKAVTRLTKAILSEEKVAIFGDYDVDGATSTAVLIRFFRAIGIDMESYIPDRIKEGYGPNTHALLALKESGAVVVVTVDCGITAFDPLATAADAGLDVIVIDHHKAEKRLPAAAAIVNPNRLDDTSGQGDLAAVGVTFLLVVALNRALRDSGWYERKGLDEPDLRRWLDLVALGTVCDVVPLCGLNRAYVKQGLLTLSRSGNAGLAALSAVAGVEGHHSAFHLGYLLGPRVNAGGRVGEAPLGARLLASDDPEEAGVMAMRLNEYNANRKDIEAAVLLDAIEQAESQIDPDASMVFVSGEAWHPGVIGIVASRLRERYDAPACVVAIDGGMAKGSGRSVPGVDLGSAVLAAKEAGLLFNGGGHAMAAGFTVEESRMEEFRLFMSDHIAQQVSDGTENTTYDIDAVVAVEGASLDFLSELCRLEPFGSGNEEPIIVTAAARVVQSRVVGNGHVSCILSGETGGKLKSIAFNSADSELGHALLNSKGRRMHLAGNLREDKWQGRSNVQLVVGDGAWAA